MSTSNVITPSVPDLVESEFQNTRDEEVAAAIDSLMPIVAPQVGASPSKHLKQLSKKDTKKGPKKEERVYPEDFDGFAAPLEMWRNTTIGDKEYRIERANPVITVKGVLHLRGRGAMGAEVLFVSPCVLQEELDSTVPQMLRGAPGNLFMRNLSRAGFADTDWYYTTIAKYNVPKLKLKAADIRWGLPAFENEIATLQPKVIVCLGKQVFDFFMGSRKFAMKDVQGGFFHSEKYNCLVYVMDSIVVPAYKPEYCDRFEVDLRNVRFELEAARGNPRARVLTQYQTIKTASHLAGLMAQLKAKAVKELAVDCEWHGQTAWSGRLRSFQFCWAPGQAAYLRLMDDKQKYAFDRPIEVVRQIIATVFNDRAVKFIGHNGSADMPWMDLHLGIDVYKRFLFDTMYAQHTVNEYADLKLERLSVRYTDLGRYDLDLLMWKKANKFDEEDNEGYGNVPDRILIPYGCRDVDATFRSRFPLYRSLVHGGLVAYYNNFVLPFVTDGFYEMVSCGLPINLEFLDDMRETFTRNRDLLIGDFRTALHQEAANKLLNVLRQVVPDRCQDVVLDLMNLAKAKTDEATAEAIELFKSCMRDHKDVRAYMPIFLHFMFAPVFNIDSKDHVARWLFDVKGLTPIKTTKRDGISLSWDKVLKLDKKRREELNPSPAADKQVIKIYAEKDKMVARLQELKAVATIVKSFLRGPDEETGKEQGIHKWVQPDGRIHGNFALTETARPRAWKPNILNWPKAITRPIESGFQRINDKIEAELRAKLNQLSSDHQDRPAIEAAIQREKKKAVSLRANVQAPEGWCIIDMDLKTAEVVALAYQSGDENMIKVLTEPDVQFARIDKDNPKKVVRLCYNSNEGIPESEWDPALLVSPDDPRILRREDGSIIHPKRDLHWEMGTSVARKPREKCDERMVRDGTGKVGNFSIPYGATANLLERMIESNTGIRPNPDDNIGENMIEAWVARYPKAAEFQEQMEEIVKSPGYWRSLSGRVRHFAYAELDEVQDYEARKKTGLLSSLARQARNFPCQEIVAATTAKALLMFIDDRRRMQIQSRIGILLYDAITAFAPLPEWRRSAKLLRECLTTRNQWNTKGGRFNFEVDATVGFRWGVKASSEEKKLIESYA